MKNKTTTPDIYFASAMLALGAKMDSVDKSDPRHMQFTLIMPTYEFSSPILQGATSSAIAVSMDFDYFEKEWANKTLLINAIDFKDAIQRMKSIIHTK